MNKKTGFLNINSQDQLVKGSTDLFAGGDAVGIANLVDAVNDGKNASWSIHKMIQEKANLGHLLPKVPALPSFFSEIDKVDLSIDMLGVKFENPFGLASAPPTTSYPMIKRAF